MDEKDLVKIGVQVALKPITEVAENAIGIAGGDWLSEVRARNRAKLRENTEKILNSSGASIGADTSPSVIKPLLAAAQDESRDSLAEMWASLVATAMDPKTQLQYRAQFVEIAKQLDPVDVKVLEMCQNTGAFSPNKRDFISRQIGVSIDEVTNSFQHLADLNVIYPAPGMIITQDQPILTALGRQFLQAARKR